MHPAPTLPRILLVDDDIHVCETVASLLRLPSRTSPDAPQRAIASHVTTSLSLPEALTLIDARTAELPAGSFPFDIVLADLDLNPHHNSLTGPASQTGLDLLRELRGRGLPVGLILFTGRTSSDIFIDAIRACVDDMLLKPVSLAALRDSVNRTFARLEDNRSQLSRLRNFADELVHLRTRLADSNQNFLRVERTVVEALLEALEIREPGSYMHALRVQAFTIYFAHAAGYPESLLPQLERAAILHDVGKIGLADQLLFKSEIMSSSEHERTQHHTVLGEQVLARIPFLRPSALIVRQHHERFDGSGYPDSLAAENIPLGARLFAIVDAFDAMTNPRPYRPALSPADAAAEIQRCAGSQFDPRLCEIFARIPLSTWSDLRDRVEQRRLTRTASPDGSLPGAIPELIFRGR